MSSTYFKLLIDGSLNSICYPSKTRGFGNVWRFVYLICEHISFSSLYFVWMHDHSFILYTFMSVDGEPLSCVCGSKPDKDEVNNTDKNSTNLLGFELLPPFTDSNEHGLLNFSNIFMKLIKDKSLLTGVGVVPGILDLVKNLLSHILNSSRIQHEC